MAEDRRAGGATDRKAGGATARGPDALLGEPIQVARVVCLFFMMYVHVNPGGDWRPDPWTLDWWTREALVDWMGRASVATLSFVSGMLALRGVRGGAVETAIAKRARTVIVPMIVANALFAIALLVGRELGVEGKSLGNIGLEEGVRGVVAGLTGLDGATNMVALAFIRDLVLAEILLLVCRGSLLAHPWLWLGGLAVACLFDLLEPLVFRPEIALFMAAGMVAADGRLDVAFRRPWACLAALAALFLANEVVAAAWFPETAAVAGGLLKRAMLIVAVANAAIALQGGRVSRFLLPFADVSFLAFLYHTMAFGAVYGLLGTAGFNQHHPLYLVFFLLCPPVWFACARLLGTHVVAALPAGVQTLLVGRAAGARAARAPQGPRPTA